MKSIFRELRSVRNWVRLTVLVLLAAMLPHVAVAMVGAGAFGFAGMIVDAQTRLDSAAVITATGVSTNTYDSLLATNHIEVGEPLAMVFSIISGAVTTTGDETYQFQVIQSANADLSAQDILLSTDTTFLSRSVLVTGYRFAIVIPPQLKTKRYLGARYVLGGNADKSITVTTDILPLKFVQNDIIYPGNFLVDS